MNDKPRLLDHIADRATLTAALELADNLMPGVNFGVRGHDRAFGRDDRSSRYKSRDLSPHSQKVSAATAPVNSWESWNGFTIYLHTLCQGPVPVLTGEDETFIVFKTELEAQKEIVNYTLLRLRQFLAGDRDYQDAITVEEYVVPVTVFPDGSFTDDDGSVFGPKRS